jgi:hypothetical protein
MATLEIRKKSLKTWLHVPSDADNFILSKFYCKTDAGTFKIVEESGSNRREYSYSDITVYDDTDIGTAETFGSAQALMLRLEVLKYTGFNRDGDIPTSYIESVVAGTNVTIDNTDPLNPIISSTGGGGTQNLNEVLVEGNSTGGENIFISDGDEISFDNGSRIRKGLTDAGNGGAKGVALVCSLDYELKWEAGRLYVMQQDGFTIREVSNNFTITPAATDDISKGFIVGSRWILDDGDLYICTDNTSTAAVWELQVIGTQNLQNVTDLGSTTTNAINVQLGDDYSIVNRTNVTTESDATGAYAFIENTGKLGINSGDFEGTIQANNLTANNVSLEFPQKAVGSYTIATTDDLTGGTVTSVGLTMPSAFSVSNTPITSSGDIAVTGAGLASQYVRGDGTLANFPSTSGGGSSVNYYLNGGTSQGTFGGTTYYEFSKTAVLGTGADFSRGTNGYIASFITDVADPSLLLIPAGNWNLEFFFSSSSAGGSPSFYAELYKYDGTTFTLIASGSAAPEGITNGTAIDAYFTALAVPETVLTVNDRLAIRVYINASSKTITLHTQNGHLCEVITTFSTGLTALNGLTNQVQYLATGTTGTDFGISSSGDTHTFNLPTASAANRGALSSANWSTFNGKQDALVSGTNIKTINGNSVLGSGNLLLGVPLTRQEFSFSGAQTFTLSGTPSDIYAVFVNGQELNSSQYFFVTTTLTISDTLQTGDKINILYTPTSVGVLEYYTKAQIDSFLTNSNIESIIGQASGVNSGYLSFTDWLDFDAKQDTITLTTNNYSGVATLIGTTLNIPNYDGFIPKIRGHETFRGVNYSNNSTTEVTSGGITIATTGSTIARSVASTNYALKQIRKGFYGSVVSTGRYTGTRGSALLWYIGGGFKYVCDVYISDTAFGSGCRQFYGMAGQTTDLAYSDSVLVSSLTNIIGIGSDALDTNLQVFHNDATGTATKVDLGVNFPANRTAGSALTTVYSIELYNDSASTDIKYCVRNKETGDIAMGTISTNLPLDTQGLNFFASRCMGAGVTNTGQFDLLTLGVYSL